MIRSQNPKGRYRPFTLSDVEIFTRIWVQPRMVLGYINEYRYDTYTLALLLITAVAYSLELAAANTLGEHMTLPLLLVITTVLGGILGTIIFYIYAAVTSWTGEWFTGLGSTNGIIRVFAYSMTPILFVLLLIIAKVVVFGPDLFKEDMNLVAYDSATSLFYVIASTIELTLAIWSIYLTVVGVSQAQRISIGKSALNVLTSALIIAIAVAVCTLPFL